MPSYKLTFFYPEEGGNKHLPTLVTISQTTRRHILKGRNIDAIVINCNLSSLDMLFFLLHKGASIFGLLRYTNLEGEANSYNYDNKQKLSY